MHAPAFWARDGLLPQLLAPASRIVAAATARRVARPRWRAPVPVICCGNLTVGGTGKTTLALDLGARLLRRGARVAFLTRGYGGRVDGVMQVSAAHDSRLAGDEALLLAAVAPAWVGGDRVASARAAIEAGATVLIMDDGLQNPGLVQDLPLLVVDGVVGFGNGRVLPAGPLREPVAAGAARCRAAVLIGADAAGVSGRLGLPILAADLEPDAPGLAGRRVVAFAGIGRPAKFFATLAQAGAEIVARRVFPDHHRYRPSELRRLLDCAARLDAVPVTTPKDAVRLPPGIRAQMLVAGVSLAWADPGAIEALLDACM